MFKGLIGTMRAHKIISAIVAIVIIGGGYYWYSSATVATTVTKYVVQDATTGTIVSSVSATGQVQAGTTIEVTPKVSETVTSIPVTVGEHVKAGQLLVQLDPTNEQNALAQAQLSLEQAQLSAQETDQVATTTLLQQQDAGDDRRAIGRERVHDAHERLSEWVQRAGFDVCQPADRDDGVAGFHEGARRQREPERPRRVRGAYADLPPAGRDPVRDDVAGAIRSGTHGVSAERERLSRGEREFQPGDARRAVHGNL